jgi:Mn-dependent DtxR family transcriptional regulator
MTFSHTDLENRRQQHAVRVLRLLYLLAREDVPADRAIVAQQLGLGDDDVETALADLERAGLADATRARLTLEGLTLALLSPAVDRQRAHAVAA